MPKLRDSKHAAFLGKGSCPSELFFLHEVITISEGMTRTP